MEIETISNYAQSRDKDINNTMDVDLQSNEEESSSPVNKVYEDNSESSEWKGPENSKEGKRESTVLESESDDECEEEKLLLSPAHSVDGGEPLSPVNRDLLDSDCEGEKDDFERKTETDKDESTEEGTKKNEYNVDSKVEMENKTEINIETEESEIRTINDSNVDNENDSVTDADKVDSDEDENDNCSKTSNSRVNKETDTSADEESEPTKKMNRKQTGVDEKIEVIEKEKNTKGSNGKNAAIVNDKMSESKVIEEDKLDEESNDADDNDESKTTKISPEILIEDEDDTDKKENKKNSSDDKEKTNSKSRENNNSPNSDEDRQEVEDNDDDMDEDFDPSLLMPELSMEVDEAPVITNNDAPAPEHEVNKSPLELYDPIFSTFVDEMTGAEVDSDLTTEELELKVQTYGTKNPVQLTKIHCTACNIHLGSALDGQGNRFVHPLLKVLICKKCYHFYTSGEFEKDEDGSELYCRWCGQGGQVMCCSTCEMVFCKKCIRINFDRRKLAEIQKSDDWSCFRCNPSQLIHLRIHCAEFMEYVQREIRLVGSAPNPEAYLNTDYCQCCLPQKKKSIESTSTSSQPKKRKRTTEDDPDYNPLLGGDSPPPLSVVQAISGPPTKMPVLTATTMLSKQSQVRPVMSQQINRSRVQVVNSAAVRPSGFIRLPASNVRLQTPTPPLSTRPPALRPIRPTSTTKHEWFEKTVRSSARVNSNLSYTLTQLNRAQANATSVEALAVVHNKLQEILSSSINNLIQIRKNLRTEFIAGIKNIRFPPKTSSTPANPPPPVHSKLSSKDDDDVIFIPSDPVPPLTAASKVTSVTKTLPSTQRLPEISLIKRTPGSIGSTVSKAGPSGILKSTSKLIKSSNSTSDVKHKGFLRVKSFSALQNVPSECITIPDDPADDEVEAVQEKDPLGDIDHTPVEAPSRTNGLTNGEKDEKESEKPEKKTDEPSNEEVASGEEAADDEVIASGEETADDEETRSVKKAKIMIERCNEIDELAKNKYGMINGNSDESDEK